MTRFLMLTQVKVKKYANHMKDLLNVLHFEMIAVQTKYKDNIIQDCLSVFVLCVNWLID